MRHRKIGTSLNRTGSHKRAMLSNMATSLVKEELIRTTLPKARELRRYIEPIITLAKVDSVHNRRRVFAKLRDSSSVGKLFTSLGVRYKDRPGGYLRLIKCGYRQGDKAPMAYVELVDRQQNDASEVEQATPDSSKEKKSTASKKSTTATKKKA